MSQDKTPKMNGYQYLVERNRLLIRLEDEFKKIETLEPSERERRKAQLEAEFDLQIAKLYAQVADEYPGERRKKGRPLEDPH